MYYSKTFLTALVASLPLASALPNMLNARASPSNGTVTNPKALAWYEASLDAGKTTLDTSYHCYGGQVSQEPAMESWASFETLFEAFSKTMTRVGDSPEEISQIKKAITDTAKGAKVDARVILSMMMQESKGDVRVPCTAGYNCGLLQGPHGSTSYEPNKPNSISDMIGQGIYGTQPNNGMVGFLNAGPEFAYTNNPSPGNPYTAMRIYNSGKVDPSGNLDLVTAGTASYVNDIANRLHGWNGAGGNFGNCGNSTGPY